MEFKNILTKIIVQTDLHVRWLNTLSLMENTGARKISASEHPVLVNEIILKHAAEEARHAYYLKKLASKISPTACPTYEFQYLLSPSFSYQYLNRLDIFASRFLKNELKLTGHQLRYAAYLLVTYAIEVRADELYPVYQQALDECGSKVNVKTIIAEEEGHLEEMIKQLEQFFPDWKTLAEKITNEEKNLFNDWMRTISVEIDNKRPVLINDELLSAK